MVLFLDVYGLYNKFSLVDVDMQSSRYMTRLRIKFKITQSVSHFGL